MTLTREEAKEQGYSGYTEHLPTMPCPRAADASIYCTSCQGDVAAIAPPALGWFDRDGTFRDGGRR